jgi:hypothetical protein
MPKQAKRRFVGLDTQEVSLVDTPANEVDFLVIKNQEGLSMGATAAKKATEAVELEVAEGGDANVAKAMAHVNDIVTKITGLVSVESVLEEAGLDPKTTKLLVTKLKKAFPFPPKKPGKGQADDGDEDDGKKTKTKKAKAAQSKADDELDALLADEPLTMAGLATAVQKAAAFTPQRIKALQSAQEILKLVLEAVGTPGTSPNANTPAVESHGNPSSVDDLTKPSKKPTMTGTLKSADGEEGEVVSLLKSLATAVGGLVTRVEKIEKVRVDSNSAENDGGTETSTKKSGSIWSGVL